MSPCRPTWALAPGKLVLTGDYAVLEPGEPALVMAVDRDLAARVKPARRASFSSTSLAMADVPVRIEGSQWRLEGAPAPRTRFVAQAAQAAIALLRARGKTVTPFHLSLEGGLESVEGLKYGFGSSAAVCVAVVGAILGAFGLDPDAPTVFKLAAWAHHRVQGRGSGIDVAASVYGGILRYVAFDRAWLQAQEDPARVVGEDWPWLGIEPLKIQRRPILAVGWTGQPASTVPLIRAAEALRAQRTPAYARFLVESRGATGALARSLTEGDVGGAILALGRAGAALHGLQELLDVSIETPALRTLVTIAEACGGLGKLSGAGGGDCGVAFFSESAQADEARRLWREAGIEPLVVDLGPQGLRLQRG